MKPAGHGLAVGRRFERWKERPTLRGTLHLEPVPVAPGGEPIVAGERVCARVVLTVPNALEYVMVEVPKPAGCEPVNPLSGWDAPLVKVHQAGAAKPGTKPAAEPRDAGRPIYRDERDDKSVFFIDAIGEGTWEIRFEMRATTAGDFRALPVEASAMHVPEIGANSAAERVRIVSP